MAAWYGAESLRLDRNTQAALALHLPTIRAQWQVATQGIRDLTETGAERLLDEAFGDPELTRGVIRRLREEKVRLESEAATARADRRRN